MSGTPNLNSKKKQTPATAPREDNQVEGLCKNCSNALSEPRTGLEVKEIVPYQSLKRTYSSTISGRVLLGLLDYCRDNKISPGRAIKELVEFRLVQLGKLPSWWYERKL